MIKQKSQDLSGILHYYYINIFLISQGACGILLHKSRECGTFYQNLKIPAAMPHTFIKHFGKENAK